ncbi:hypothetical protein Cme02nite_29870 [Catellatospora methionotrophica]|uniref:Uncharacterized protein n=1 Tax=Catellatospora methionotrophica TaxID=121620 RepID=A0A8J3LKY9_9ACTN|nr:hypothetical protein [Catellatospora methionotrophica]GIG14655.1 hypothetical protein Cme02nite_29870 [Catellatospora methionotrophica]
MSWADKPNGHDWSRRAGTAEPADFDGDIAVLRQRGRHLIAELVRLSRQLADLQKAIRSRRGATGVSRGGGFSGGEPR